MVPNILLITADQWRADCLSILGHPSVRTPNLDRLARQGVLFANHWSQATPCGPARASLLTGTYAFNHRSITNGTPLDARHRTIAEILARAGYACRLFGYTDTSVDPRTVPPGDPRLFTYEGVAAGFCPELLLLEDLEPWLAHLAERGYGRHTLADLHDRPVERPAPWRAEDSETAFLTDAFLAWLDRRPAEPWFVHLSWIKPHPPWLAAQPWHGLVDRARVPAAVACSGPDHPWLIAHRAIGYEGWVGRHVGQPGRIAPDRLVEARAVYYGLVSEVDFHLGRILEALARRELLDRTLLVVTSDHGEMLGDHGLFGKSGFFPQAFRVPLVIRDPRPGAARGLVVRDFTEHVDLFPTLCEAAGTRVPLQCDGLSLSRHLTGERPVIWRQAAVCEHHFADPASRTYEQRLGLSEDACGLILRVDRRSLYVHFFGLPPLLFDLASDPDCCRDLAAQPARLSDRLACAEALLAFRMCMGERRLSRVRLTPSGPVGRFDPD
ncbi:Arylsulfatase [bacterium HR40]|nr:Arylsulfatase [bacterium HR40]